jgi:ABC-type lipoprotein release transport system permease subunit
MLTVKMAFRNLQRHKRRSFFTGLTILGGFVLSSLSLGIAEGSYDAIIKAFTQSSTGNIQIHKKGYLDNPSIYKTIEGPQKLENKILKMEQVKSTAPRIYFPSLIFLKNKTNAAQVVGINPEKEAKTTTITKKIDKGIFLSQTPKKEVMLGATIAKMIKADIGMEISMVSQGYDGSIANDNFKVTAILQDDKSQEGINVYMHVKTARDFFYMPNAVHEIVITLKNHSKSVKTAKLINSRLTGTQLTAEPWQIVKKDFYRAMQADKKGNHISLIVIMIIVAVGVLNTVLMSVLERTREFGVLKALGTKPMQIAKLIMLETTFLTIFSIAAGLIAALVLNYYFAVHGIKMSHEIHYGGIVFDKIISTLKVKIFLIPALVTFFTALTVAVFPALRAAKITSVKAMKDF